MTESCQPSGATLEFTLHLKPPQVDGKQPVTACRRSSTTERIPRIAKLLALAIQFDGMLQKGQVKNCAAIARVGHVSRARLTQIMSLLELAPAIQEQILFLSCPAETADPLRERTLRALTKLPRWDVQQRRFEEILRAKAGIAPGSSCDRLQASSA